MYTSQTPSRHLPSTLLLCGNATHTLRTVYTPSVWCMEPATYSVHAISLVHGASYVQCTHHQFGAWSPSYVQCTHHQFGAWSQLRTVYTPSVWCMEPATYSVHTISLVHGAQLRTVYTPSVWCMKPATYSVHAISLVHGASYVQCTHHQFGAWSTATYSVHTISLVHGAQLRTVYTPSVWCMEHSYVQCTCHQFGAWSQLTMPIKRLKHNSCKPCKVDLILLRDHCSTSRPQIVYQRTLQEQ